MSRTIIYFGKYSSYHRTSELIRFCAWLDIQYDVCHEFSAVSFFGRFKSCHEHTILRCHGYVRFIRCTFLGSSKHWIDNIGHSSRLSLMFFFNSWFAISLLGLVSESSNRTPINYFLWPKLAVLIQLLLSVRPCLKLPFLTIFSIFPVVLLLTTYIACIPFVSVLKVQRIILDPLQDISCSYLY